jgi:hypothetical protein
LNIDLQDATPEAFELIRQAAPEQLNMLQDSFSRLNPTFRVRRNVHGWSLDAGFGGVVSVTEVALQQLWVLSHGAWQAYRFSGGKALEALRSKYAHDVPGIDYAEAHQRVVESKNIAQEIGDHPAGELPKLPAWLPTIDNFREGQIEDQAVAHSAWIGRAFCYLHELEHLNFDSRGRDGVDPLEEEELCDGAAIEYLLGSAQIYAEAEGVNVETVVFKRALGIAIALYGIASVSSFSGISHAGTHPDPSIRFAQLATLVLPLLPAHHAFWVVLHAILCDVEKTKNGGRDVPDIDYSDPNFSAQAGRLVLSMCGIKY